MNVPSSTTRRVSVRLTEVQYAVLWQLAKDCSFLSINAALAHAIDEWTRDHIRLYGAYPSIPDAITEDRHD